MIMTDRTQPEAPQYDESGHDWNATVDRFAVERVHLRTTWADLAVEVAAALKAAGLSRWVVVSECGICLVGPDIG